MDLNVIAVVGRIGKPIETKFLPDGKAVANFSVSYNNGKNADGTYKDSTWFDVACFGKTAEFAQKYLGKGSKVSVQGKMTSRKWQAQDGSQRVSWSIQCDNLDSLDPAPQNGSQGHSEAPAQHREYQDTDGDPFAEGK